MKKLDAYLAVGCLLAAFLFVVIPPELYGQGKDNIFNGAWLTSNLGQLAPLPEGREGYCLGIAGDRIFMTHGLPFASGDSGDVRAYDINTNTWTSRTSSPNHRSEGVGVSHGGFIYCLGGRFASALNLVERYDPTTDSWTTLAPMQTARAGLAATTKGNKIYTFGGRAAIGGPCSGLPLNVAEAYDIVTNTWSPITPPPTPVTDAVAVEHGGLIYLIGGCTAPPDNPVLEDTTNALQIYNPNTDTWAAGAHMPTARASLAAAVLGNTIYAIGGRPEGLFDDNTSAVEAFDIDKGLWAGPLAAKPSASSEAFAVAHGGIIYVPGSGAFGASFSFFEAFRRK